ncbi:OmpA family protein [Verrucomicrobiaceae bacterium 227]
MAHEYSWETTSSSYVPPRRDPLGWFFLVAVILALIVHVFLIVFAGQHFIRLEIAEPRELVTEPIRLTTVETEIETPAEEPPEEELEQPVIDTELVDSVEDAIAELQNTEIDIDTQIEDVELPEMKIEKPALVGDEDGELLTPTIGPDVNPDIPEPGRIKLDFPEASKSQLLVADDGAPLADLADPDAILAELGKVKGAGGDSEAGVISGYTGLDAYAKMSPGDLQRNKASIGSDLLFRFNESTLRDDARLTLMTVAMLIDRNPTMYCWVEGHSDLFGGDEFNMKLSEKRGDAVKDWLVKALQLSPSRIIVRPFGKTQPIVLEGDVDQQAPNRRVDIKMRKTRPEPAAAPVKMLVKPGKAVVVQEDVPKAQLVPKEDIPKAEVVREDEEVIPKAQVVREDEEIPKAIPVSEDE